MKFISTISVAILALTSTVLAWDRSQLKCGPEGFPTEYTLFNSNQKNFTPEQQAIAQRHWDDAYGCEAKNAALDAAGL